MKSVGIDIGSFSIKVAEVDAGGKAAGTIIGYQEHLLNPDPRADRQLELVEILRAIAQQYDPVTTRIVVGVPQSDISVRLKHFPFKERPKILKSLAFELEDEIALDPDDAVFEAKICEYVGDSAEVLALACPIESIANVISKFKDGGIDPDIISAEGLALGNICERWQLPPPQVPASGALADGGLDDEFGKKAKSELPPSEGHIVLDIGHSRTLLLAYRENALIFVRSIYWGGVEVVDALARTFNVPFVEAVKILQKKSFILMSTAGASRDQITLSKSISDQVDNLIREVRFTMIDLKSEHNTTFTRIDLLGGVSQIQNLAPYLTQNLEVTANLYHYFETQKTARFETSPATETAAAVAIGLAIEGVKKPRNPAINFRKGEFARQNKSLQLFWEKWRPALVTVTAVFLIFSVFAFIRDMMADSLVEIIDEKVGEQAAVINLPKKQRSVSGVRRYISETRKEIQNRERLSKLDNYNSALDVMKQISEGIPLGQNIGGEKLAMEIRRLSVDNESVVIEGYVKNQQQLDSVRKALEKISVPKSLIKGKPSATQPPATGVPFAFEFKVNRMAN